MPTRMWLLIALENIPANFINTAFMLLLTVKNGLALLIKVKTKPMCRMIILNWKNPCRPGL